MQFVVEKPFHLKQLQSYASQARFTPQVSQGKTIICISNNNLNPTKLKPGVNLKKKVFWSAKPKPALYIIRSDQLLSRVRLFATP